MARSDPKDLVKKLDRAREMVQVGGFYRHHTNGSLYKVDAIALREEDLSPSVQYHAVEEPDISWNRKVAVFVDRFYRVELSLPPSEVPKG